MKTKNLYIGVVLLFCFVFQVQAQDIAITEYNAKLEMLSGESAEQLDKLINGAPNVLYINNEGVAATYLSDAESVQTMYLEKPGDASIITNSDLQTLYTVKAIVVHWDGNSEFALPNAMLEQLSNLEYVYIRSYETLSKEVLESRFSVLIAQLLDNTSVDLLFYTMEEPR